MLREISAAMTPNVTCSAIVACPNYARDERENVPLGVVGKCRGRKFKIAQLSSDISFQILHELDFLSGCVSGRQAMSKGHEGT